MFPSLKKFYWKEILSWYSRTETYKFHCVEHALIILKRRVLVRMKLSFFTLKQFRTIFLFTLYFDMLDYKFFEARWLRKINWNLCWNFPSIFIKISLRAICKRSWYVNYAWHFIRSAKESIGSYKVSTVSWYIFVKVKFSLLKINFNQVYIDHYYLWHFAIFQVPS